MNKLIPLILLFFAFNVYSQKQANIWYFGENAGLDFSTNPPTALTDGGIDTYEGCSSFSDADGNLLFYSDGITVWDKNHKIMQYTDLTDADNLKGDPSSTQSGMIIPKPGSNSIYYLFTVDDGPEYDSAGLVEDGKGLNAYTIDIALGGGVGQLIDENSDGVFYKDLSDGKFNNWEEKVAAVKGKDCETYWIVSVVDNQFYSYLVTDTGISTTPVISNISTSMQRRGYLKISPDGTKLAIANQSDDFRNSAILYDFSSETGEVSNSEIKLIDGVSSGLGEAYGVEFSSDSKKLYISTTSGYRGFLFNTAVTYKLFQFNLESANIPESRELIHTQIPGSSDYPEGGYRGALQLGPDGKIYTTIPLAYSNGFAAFLDVIENPTADAGDVIFTKNAIELKGKFATQGLPPFISSLLLPIKISDDSGIPSNNVDLKTCIGSSKVITPETIININNLNYIWTFDDGSLITIISNSSTQKSLILSGIQLTDTGTYKLKIEGNDDCGNPVEYNATFNLEVFDAASAKPNPKPIYFCDSDATVPNLFDFRKSKLSEKSTEILGALDDTKFEVLYFDTPAKATDNVTGSNLPDSYQLNTPGSQIIYARVHNKNAPEACFDITDFRLVITNLPIAVQPEPYRICDDLESGSDTDGKINTFLLNTRDSEVLGTLDTNQYDISYHTTQNGADTNDVSTVIPKDSNHSVTSSQTLFVRVQNKDNPACYDADKTLDLFVDSLPILKTNPELEQCISVDDNSPTVNLTTAEVNISETANVTFDYFEDAAGTTQITDPTSYAVIVNTSQSVFVRVTSEFNCARDLIELTINVGQTPDNPYNDIQPAVCDDFLDADGNNSAANSDTDFITNFSLDENAIIASINPPTNTVVYFYENADDRNNTLNEIDITNYRNDIDRIDITTIASGIQFPIYYKILSTVNNNCQGLGQFYLLINATPAVSSNTLSPISACDTGDIDGNYTNGSNRNINLTQRIDELFLGTNQDQNDYDVTFYKSVTAAFSGDNTNPDYIDAPTQFTNDIPSGFSVGDIVTQSIFIRLQNKTTGCANPHARFEVIINPIPIITNPIPVLEVCDIGTNDGDVRNGLAQNIAISIRDIDIIGTKIAANFTITYHKTRADAEDLSSTGIDKNSYDSDPTRVTINPTTNRSEESLLIRIVDNSSGCAFDQSTLTIVVYPEPTFEAISNLSECDNNDDGDDANQIIQTIDLDGKITEILGASQDPDDYIVTFHATQANATSGGDAISSPYTNAAAKETIYIRIQSKATSCVNDDASFDVLVNSLPDFTATSPQILCLNDTPKNIYIEDPLEIYSYVWRDVDGNTIGVKDNLDVTSGGNYTVTGTTTNGTNCSRTQTIVVNESNPAILLNSFITIIDQGNNIGSENKLSISIDTISNDLGPGNYQFAILNTNDATRTPFVGFQDKPLFENLEGAIYTIIVNDKNGCVPDATLEVSVLQFPEFFTPNGDGRNDTYIIKGANKTFYPNSSINIFNRYGKLVAQIPIDSKGWDGTYNGKKLSSDDYWYNITLIPADKTKQIINKTGNFSLLRK
jgi:gliding motility-associated-like protein